MHGLAVSAAPGLSKNTLPILALLGEDAEHLEHEVTVSSRAAPPTVVPPALAEQGVNSSGMFPEFLCLKDPQSRLQADCVHRGIPYFALFVPSAGDSMRRGIKPSKNTPLLAAANKH